MHQTLLHMREKLTINLCSGGGCWMSTCAWKKGKTDDDFHRCLCRIADCASAGTPLYPWFKTKWIEKTNSFHEYFQKRADWISYKEEEGQKNTTSSNWTQYIRQNDRKRGKFRCTKWLYGTKGSGPVWTEFLILFVISSRHARYVSSGFWPWCHVWNQFQKESKIKNSIACAL